MAEGRESNEEGGWWGAWGKDWYDSIKEKSTATLELVQKDLTEFVSTIQHDTAVAVVETATKVDEKVQPTKDEDESAAKSMKQGLSKILTTVSDSLKTLTVEDDKTEERQVLLESGQFAAQDLDAKQSRIYALQTDPATFSEDPSDCLDEYHQWAKDFDIESKKPQMSSLLVNAPEVRTLYTNLVPVSVPHTLFWQRYFFKLHLIELEEERRAALIARVRTESGDDAIDDWGDDEDAPAAKTTDAAEPHIQPKVENQQPRSTSETIDPEAKKGLSVTANASEARLEEGKALSDQCPVPTVSKDINASVYQNVTESNEQSNLPSVAQNMSLEDPKAEQKTLHLDDQQAPSLSYDGGTIEAASSTTGHAHVMEDDKLIAGSEGVTIVRPGSADSQKRASSESTSSGSWESIDDNGLTVKAHKHAHHVSTPTKSPDIVEVASIASSGVLVNREDARSEDWDELRDDSDELELDEDISEEELNKLVQQAKEKAKDGTLNDDGIDEGDDDWETWE